MKVLSLFSGVGGFDMGLENAGMQTIFQCEWDKHANTILNKHWPHVPKWEDVSTLTGKHILAHAPVIDVVAWGSPCQDLSVAGKRSGLEGERSGLFHEGIRIIKELRKETNGQYPRISIWENVVGALNSNRGADFGIILNEMAEAGALVIEWAVLDAQYFGVPQRRRRVFVIAIFDPVLAERCPETLLPVAESLPRHLAKGKPKTQNTTNKTAKGIGADGGILGSDIVGSLNTSDAKMISNQYVRENKCVVEPVLFENSYRDGARIANDGVTQTLSAKMGTGGGNTPMIAIPIQDGRDIEKHQNGLGVGDEHSPAYTIDQTGAQAVAYGIQGSMIGRQDHNGPGGKGVTEEDGPMFTLTSTDVHAVSQEEPTVFQPGTMVRLNGGVWEGTVPTLRAESKRGDNEPHIQIHNAEPTMAVRRLTPLECERLMGWPDDHTRYKADGTEQTDGHRYKQCGNGVASPVAQWIAKHLLKLEEQQ
jgi:DNA (cytosine-5)-methyltransferase 1